MLMAGCAYSMIVMDVAAFHRERRSRRKAEVVLVSVVEGNVAGNVVHMCRQVWNFVGNPRYSVAVLMVHCGFSVEAMAVQNLWHKNHLVYILCKNIGNVT